MEDSAPLFFSVEAVEQHVGFSLPHPRDLQGWRLEQVDLLPTASSADAVSLTYRSDIEDPLLPPSPMFVFEVAAPGRDLPPAIEPGLGAPQRIYIGQELAMLRSELLVEEMGPRPEFRSALVEWQLDGRSLRAKAILREDSDFFGPGFTLDRFFSILETVA